MVRLQILGRLLGHSVRTNLIIRRMVQVVRMSFDLLQGWKQPWVEDRHGDERSGDALISQGDRIGGGAARRPRQCDDPLRVHLMLGCDLLDYGSNELLGGELHVFRGVLLGGPDDGLLIGPFDGYRLSHQVVVRDGVLVNALDEGMEVGAARPSRQDHDQPVPFLRSFGVSARPD
jgi:hypothetical protein